MPGSFEAKISDKTVLPWGLGQTGSVSDLGLRGKAKEQCARYSARDVARISMAAEK